MSIFSKLYLSLKPILTSFFYASWFFIVDIKHFLILSAALVVFDTITGIFAAKKRGEKVTSKGFSRMITKMAVYFAAILSAAGLQSVFFTDANIEFLPNLFLVKMVSGSICITEFLSLRENALTITGVDILGGLKKNLSRLLDAIPRENK